MTRYYVSVLVWVAAMGGGLTACAGKTQVATFEHDFNGTKTLFSYPAEPAAERRAGEQIATKMYGEMGIRSPRTPYICVWRDTDPTRFRAPANAGPPKTVFLTCSFGTEAWEPPANLIEYAQQAMMRDNANIRIGWKWSDNGYKLDRVEVEIGDPKAKNDFRSIWFGDEVSKLNFKRNEIAFPKSPVEPIKFDIAASLPQRFNRNDPTKAPTVALTLKGMAQPIPQWVNY